jgi:hypothetical protein
MTEFDSGIDVQSGVLPWWCGKHSCGCLLLIMGRLAGGVADLESGSSRDQTKLIAK